MHVFNELIAGYHPLAATPGAQYGGIVSNSRAAKCRRSRRYASPDPGNQRIFAGNRSAPRVRPRTAGVMLLGEFCDGS